MDLDDVLRPLIDHPSSSGVCCDFDGTLSPIVDDPARARPAPGAVKLLGALVERYAVVAVISGRPVAFLEPLLPEGVVLSGLYGLETIRDGVRVDHPGAGAWREAVEDVVAASRSRGPKGMLVEPKGLSLTLHFRTDPELQVEARAWAAEQAARSGLAVREARMSVELHPPVAVDKGTAVRELLGGLAAGCFVGDDAGDLPAFAALGDLAADGVAVARIAVRSPEAPPALLAAADAVVDGNEGVLDVLRRLAV